MNILYGASLEGIIEFLFYGHISLTGAKNLHTNTSMALTKLLEDYLKGQQDIANLLTKQAKLGVSTERSEAILRARNNLKEISSKLKAQRSDASFLELPYFEYPGLGKDCFENQSLATTAFRAKAKEAGIEFDESKLRKVTTDVPQVSIVDQNEEVIVDAKTITGSNLAAMRYGWGRLDPRLFINWSFPFTVSEEVKSSADTLDTSAEVQTIETLQTLSAGKFWPLPEGTSKVGMFSSKFGDYRSGTNKTNWHRGLDIAVTKNPVYAPCDCYLINYGEQEAKYDQQGRLLNISGGCFLRVMSAHDGTVHEFMHLERNSISSAAKSRGMIQAKTPLAVSGNTGCNGAPSGRGYHLHWSVWQPVNRWGIEQARADLATFCNQTNKSYLDPLVWLKTDIASSTQATGAANTSNAKPAVTPTVEAAKLDWLKEEEIMERWHRNCLAGWASAIPEGAKLGEIDADETDPKILLDRCQADPRGYQTYEEVSYMGRNSGWLGTYCAHGAAISVALRKPATGWGFNRGIGGAPMQDSAFQAGTRTRADLISELLQKLDYYWWVTGNGDIVFDFPHYEMIPEHLGANWAPQLRLQNLTYRDQLTEYLDELNSVYIFEGGYGFFKQAGAQALYSVAYSVVFPMPTILARNGVSPKRIQYPFIPHKDNLKILGAIYVRKQLANSYRYNCSQFPPLFYILPNTPVHIAEINSYALCDRIGFSFSLTANGMELQTSTVSFTALRLPLSPEQAYLNTVDVKKLTSQELAERSSGFSYKHAPVSGWTPVQTSAEEYGRLRDLAANHSYILGGDNLILNYHDWYVNNLNSASEASSLKNNAESQVLASGDLITLPPRIVPSKTETVETEQGKLELPSSGNFDTSKQPTAEVKEQAVEAAGLSKLSSSGVAGMLSHANVVSGFQQAMVIVNQAGDMAANALGLYGLTQKAMKTIKSTLVHSDKLASAQIQPKLSANLTAQQAINEIQQQAKEDPRMDPQASALIAAQIVKTFQANALAAGASEVPQLLLSCSIRFGADDPALLKTAKEPGTNLLQTLLQNMQFFGTYSVEDFNYVQALNSVQVQAGRLNHY